MAGVNFYVYVDNKPVEMADSLGLSKHRVSACGSRFVSGLGGVQKSDKIFGNNMLGFCMRCVPPEVASGPHIVPEPPVSGGDPHVQVVPVKDLPGYGAIAEQCGCNGPGEQIVFANIKTSKAITSSNVDDKKLFYSLEYNCNTLPCPVFPVAPPDPFL